MATMVSQGHSPWTLLRRAFGLARKPAPTPRTAPRQGAYDDFFALQQRKGPRTAPKK